MYVYDIVAHKQMNCFDLDFFSKRDFLNVY